MSFKLVAIAGTFDRLHKGHEEFVSQAFKIGHKVIIGLTSDKFQNSKLKSPAYHACSKLAGRQNAKLQLKTQNFVERKEGLIACLKKLSLLERTEIIKIDDIYGPAIKKESGIEALVVTSNTLAGARKVNKKRKELGLHPLRVIKVPMILASDKRRICSTRIRQGEIDREGRVFAKTKIFGKATPEGLRLRLKEPLGILIKGRQDNLHHLLPSLKKAISKINPVIVITVGDQVTRLCNEAGFEPEIAIVDFRVQRKKIYKRYGELGFKYEKPHHRIKNPPGFITRTLAKAVSRAIRHFINSSRKQLIRVIGEEDLAGVPAILLAPLGSVVLYGQPGEGVVLVEVTEDRKEKLVGQIRIVSHD